MLAESWKPCLEGRGGGQGEEGGDAGEEMYDLNLNPPCWENKCYTTFPTDLFVSASFHHSESFEQIKSFMQNATRLNVPI